MPVIGYLSALSEPQAASQLVAFRQGLNNGASLMARTSQSNFNGPTVNATGFLPWRPIWCAVP
jgi:hypothetical protein